MRYDLTTIGEGQIRLTCERGDRLATARSLRMTAAGSEANVAGLLSELGRSTAWTTKLPRGELADRIALEYSAVGVDMSHVVMTDEGRVALYFLERASSRCRARSPTTASTRPSAASSPRSSTGTPCSTPAWSSSPGSPRP